MNHKPKIKNLKFLQSIIYKLKANNGVSLMEFITALFVLVIIITSTTSSFLSVFQASRKAVATQNVTNESRFVLEIMAREIRTGTNITGCGTSALSDICFINDDNIAIKFNLNLTDKIIERTEGLGGPSEITLAITSTNISVDNLNFNLRGESPPPDLNQPFITISLAISNKAEKPESQSEINLQVSVSQRKLDA